LKTFYAIPAIEIIFANRFYDGSDVAMTRIYAVASRFVELVVLARDRAGFKSQLLYQLS